MDLAEIFRAHGPAYREKLGTRMPESHRRAMDAIESCRTEALGGQVYFCPQALLLATPAFLVTFTVPQELRDLVRCHTRGLLDILFRASAEALQPLARDPRFVGGQIGMVAVLHTWTRDLLYRIPSRYEDFLVHVRPLAGHPDGRQRRRA